MNKISSTVGTFSIIAALLFHLPAQSQLTQQERNSTIDSMLIKLQDNYVFPAKATAMSEKIRLFQRQKRYDSITDGHMLAQQLTRDLQSVSKDRHINVHYSEKPIPSDLKPMELPEGEKEGYHQYLKNDNYGIGKVDVLKGNIGYIDFKYLSAPEFAGHTYASMMNYISHTEALIIDLRNCRGSTSPDAIPFLLSYFFENPVHLNDLHWRKGNKIHQSWTYAYVPGKKYTKQPIYVLTSAATFSGAEEMAYDLQNLKRAVIMGEVTGGGANPGGEIYITQHFSMFVPVGQAINPITKTNWEGVGVKPDSLMVAGKALHRARLAATRKVMANTNDEGWRGFLQQTIHEIERDEPVYTDLRFVLKGYDSVKQVFVTGSFNNWSPEANPMKKENGEWVVNIQAEPGKLTYKFIVDGKYITDPGNPLTESEGAYTNSLIIVRDKINPF